MKRYLPNNHSKLWIIALLALIIALGVFLRFYQIGKLSFWTDEAYTHIYAKGSLINALKTDPNMSLYNILVHYWVRIFPNASDGALRSLSAIFSVMGIPVVYLLGRAMTADWKKSVSIGLIAALLISLNAFHIQYAQEFRSYSLVLLLTSLSTLLLIKTVEDPGSKYHWPIWYTILTASVVYGHFLAGFLILAQWVTLPVLLFDRRKSPDIYKRLLYCGIGTVCLLIPSVYAALHKGPGMISWISEPTLQVIKDYLIQITGKQGTGLAALYFSLGLIGLLSGMGVGSQQDLITKWKYTLMASCLFVPLAAGLAISKFILPIFMPYYFLYVMPYLAVLAAAGVVRVVFHGWEAQKFRGLSSAAGVGVLALFALFSVEGIRSYYRDNQKEDWRAAAEFLTENCSDALRLYYQTYIAYNTVHYDQGLFSQAYVEWKKALGENFDVDTLAAAIPKGYPQLCLVLGQVSEEQSETHAVVIQAAILKQYQQERSAQFYGAEVIIYSLAKQ